ncbi:Gfo/Idh/MocA family protein [Melghirimyces algeriensis]|uniref:Predicted dehydrogenase n=1 Tax=Melghirimyces algeriensis TaxID=910412 RepID=A0A521EZ28_9BACL|nr:Gfo/Idh/MocA family oxidoreductase [Melghirimyces algeriensis]SMO89194.1 Predicted dehydrogenase [Melghirimyces algeriensis]
MEKLRVGVIGCGSIAKYRHIPEYAEDKRVELVAFCDPVHMRARAFADQYGGKVYTDYKEMLEETDLDAVSVCTPNVWHAPITIAAANAGKHILCEKPMATSTAEGKAMIAAAQDNNVHLMIGHNQRLMPPHIKAKELLTSGKLGEVRIFRTVFAHGGPETWSVEGEGGWFFQKEQAAIGAMGDLGVHKVDLIRWLLDDEVQEVAGMTGILQKETADVDDNAVVIMRMRHGAMGTMTASWTHQPGEDNSTVLYCSNGIVRIGTDPIHQVIVEWKDKEVERFQTGSLASNEEGGQEVNSGIITAFVDGVLQGTPPLIPGEEGLKSLSVILAVLKSVDQKRLVHM